MEKDSANRRRTNVSALLHSPGLYILIGGLEALFLIHLAEMVYPDYSVSSDYISDLGIGPALPAALFTAAVILFGLMALLSSALMRKEDKKSLLWLFVALSGVGAICVGLFNENVTLVHRPAALTAFLFGNLAALYSYRRTRPPLSYVFGMLGLIGLSALALFGAGIYLGLGIGGMERMILYPAMFWAIGFGAFRCAEETRETRSRIS